MSRLVVEGAQPFNAARFGQICSVPSEPRLRKCGLRPATYVVVVGSSSSGGRPRSTGSIASMGGPPPSVTRSAFRCCFFSSLSRRLLTRASSLRRFWNLVFDRLAKALPSRTSNSLRNARPIPTAASRTAVSQHYDRLSQCILFNALSGSSGTAHAGLHPVGLRRPLGGPAEFLRVSAVAGGHRHSPRRIQRETHFLEIASLRLAAVWWTEECARGAGCRLVASGAARVALRPDFLQLGFLALGLADAECSAALIFRRVRVVLLSHLASNLFIKDTLTADVAGRSRPDPTRGCLAF